MSAHRLDARILSVTTEGDTYTVAELRYCLSDTRQKVTGAMTRLVAQGRFVRIDRKAPEPDEYVRGVAE